MEVTIGVYAREGALRVQVPDDEVDALRKRLEGAVSSDKNELVWVKDKEGREYGIPTDKIAFVEIGGDKSARQVGFSSAAS